MSVEAGNAVPVGASFTKVSTFGPWRDPKTKLDAFVNNTDVVFELMLDPSGWQDAIGNPAQLVLMRMGFNGRDPLPPFYGVRFKVWSGTTLNPTGTVDFAAFAV